MLCCREIINYLREINIEKIGLRIKKIAFLSSSLFIKPF